MTRDSDPIDIGSNVWQTVSDVSIWRFGLDRDAQTVVRLRKLLNADELRRADRYVTSQLRIRFVVSRAALRIVLANRLGDIEPDEVKFSYGSHDKPFLAASELRFNLAHSHDLALLAVSRNREVGIDLERIDRRVEIEEIADRFFTAKECADMMALTGTSRRGRFFDLWCCKEAYLKAVGVGISGGLNTCRIDDASDGTASVHNPDDPKAVLHWRIHRLQPAVGFAGALCVRVD